MMLPGCTLLECSDSKVHGQGLPEVGVRTWYLIADEETCSPGRGWWQAVPLDDYTLWGIHSFFGF